MRESDQRCASDLRSVALVIDDCPTHPRIENLKSIKWFFLHPNTTSTTYAIRSLKAKYRKIIRSLENNKAMPKILDGVLMLVSTWNVISIKTILNCFLKVGISIANQEAAIDDNDDPFKNLQDEIDALRNIERDLKPEDINAASLTDFDVEVSTVDSPSDRVLLSCRFIISKISYSYKILGAQHFQSLTLMDILDCVRTRSLWVPRKSLFFTF